MHQRAHGNDTPASTQRPEAKAEGWPMWLRSLSESSRSLVGGAMVRAGFESQAALLATLDRGGGQEERSRQARHAQLTRMRSTAAVSSLMLATSDPEARRFILSREGALLRPLTSEVHTKARSLPLLLRAASGRHVARLFAEGAEVLLAAGSQLDEGDPVEVLRVHGACAAMSVAAFLSGSNLGGAWQELWDEARRRGLLERRHLRLRLATLGSWAGRTQAHVEVLLDEGMRSARSCDAYFFVRNDMREELYTLGARLIRGDTEDPSDFLLPGRPASTLRHGLEYIKACLRDVQHLRTSSQVLMLLTGIEDSSFVLSELRRQRKVAPNAADLLLVLQSFERVQLMEKRRFWSVCDTMEDGPAKERVVQLWSRDYERFGKRVLLDPAQPPVG